MASNRKYSNGMWKDTSKQQDKKSNELFLTFQSSHGRIFEGMSMGFDQVSGDCAYTYRFPTHEYVVIISRTGLIIQEGIVNRK
jgi:hypothetical protein